MLNCFVLCCNFSACKYACTVVVRSPRGGWGTVTWQPFHRAWCRTVFGGVGNGIGGGGGRSYDLDTPLPPDPSSVSQLHSTGISGMEQPGSPMRLFVLQSGPEDEEQQPRETTNN